MVRTAVQDIFEGYRGAARLLILVISALLTGCGERAGEARLLLQDIAAGHAASELKRATALPDREPVIWRIDGRDGAGDLYTPAEGALARMVLVPGLTEQGRADPRVTALAYSLSRMRFAVLVPDIANLRRLRVGPEDSRAIADAALALTGMPAGGAASPVGLAAVSYAVGPALIGALEPDTARHVGFLVSIGGYHDMTAVVTYLTTGRYRAPGGGRWQTGRPHGLAKWRFVAVNADQLDEPGDRATFAVLARRRIANPSAAIDDLSAGLGPQGRALLALLENRDPDVVPELIAGLPPRLRDAFAALSPSRYDLTTLGARLILVHGEDDPAVPVTESMALSAAVAPGRADLFLLDGLDHVDFRSEIGLMDQLTLLDAAQAVLAERDRIAGRED